jgi:hypothetical protein
MFIRQNWIILQISNHYELYKNARAIQGFRNPKVTN